MPALRAIENDESDGHVLIVEDDADLRQSIVFVLMDAGYIVSGASDGLQALHLLEDGLRPDLILLDLMMPNMNGFEFRDAQQKHGEFATIPVIVWTAHSETDDFIAPLRAEGLLRKPFDIAVLLGMIERILRGGPGERMIPT